MVAVLAVGLQAGCDSDDSSGSGEGGGVGTAGADDGAPLDDEAGASGRAAGNESGAGASDDPESAGNGGASDGPGSGNAGTSAEAGANAGPGGAPGSSGGAGTGDPDGGTTTGGTDTDGGTDASSGGTDTSSGGTDTSSGGTDTSSGGTDTSSGGTDTSSGGTDTSSGGTDTSSGGTDTSSGGTVATGGMTATGGTGGNGTPGECATCGSASCDAEFTRCEASPICTDWLACVTACASDACAEDCDETYRDAVLLTVPVYECLCSECDAECTPVDVCGRDCDEGDAPPAPASTPADVLTDTGLYTATGPGGAWELAPYIRSYRPEYELFADFSTKERYIYLPACEQIDTGDMDHWILPVGTRIWKQFTRDGVRIETRMLARFGPQENDWTMSSYQWPLPVGSADPDPSLAMLASSSGVLDANGTQADIPSVNGCRSCHEPLTERALSFSAIQLSHDIGGSVTFTDLVDWGVLTDAPVATGYDPPGDATAQTALGYLHANCGNCHNDTGVNRPMFLRLLVDQTSVSSTWAYSTSANAATVNQFFQMDRIEPGNPSQSSIVVRMQINPSIGESLQMPPLGRDLPDPDGIAAVSAWIQQLTP